MVSHLPASAPCSYPPLLTRLDWPYPYPRRGAAPGVSVERTRVAAAYCVVAVTEPDVRAAACVAFERIREGEWFETEGGTSTAGTGWSYHSAVPTGC